MKILFQILPLFTLILIFGCNDILEEDVSAETIRLVSPANGIETDIQNIGFLWDKIENNNTYRLQVVTPNFQQPVSFLLDSLVNSNSFNLSLNPGEYQWRVRAENSAYFSDYSTNSFKIDSLSNPINQIIELLSPKDSAFSKGNTIFSWTDLVGTVQYQFELIQNETLIIDSVLFANEIFISGIQDGNYYWRVKAFNALGESAFSERQITIDNTPPSAPTLNSPFNNQNVLADSVILIWNSSSDVVSDSIFLWNSVSNESVSLFPKSTNTKNLKIKLNSGDYSWYVKSLDRAGNVSDSSEVRQFSMVN